MSANNRSSLTSHKLETIRLVLAIVLGATLLIMTTLIPYIAPSILTSPSFGSGKSAISYYIIVVALLASVMQFTLGLRFYKAACQAIKHCSLTMDVLVVISITVAYGYGVVLIFLDKEKAFEVRENAHLFETSSLLSAIVIIGKYLEAYAKRMAVKGL